MLDPVWARCSQAANPTVVYSRLNKRNYKPGSGEPGVDFVRVDLIKDGQPRWFRPHDDDVDAAIISLSAPSVYEPFDTGAVLISDFPTDVEIASQSIGDAVISAGLLPGLAGKSRNYPIFKFGQISNIPSEDVETGCGNGSPRFPVKVWLIAANLVQGNSGSPIFHVPWGGSGISIGGTRAMLLGVQSVSFIGADVAGMTPIQYVYEMLQNIGFSEGDFSRGPRPPAPQPNPPTK
jgi:hypothetical protein